MKQLNYDEKPNQQEQRFKKKTEILAIIGGILLIVEVSICISIVLNSHGL